MAGLAASRFNVPKLSPKRMDPAKRRGPGLMNSVILFFILLVFRLWGKWINFIAGFIAY
ncbi:hypothetical protein D3C85_1415870 [compost metagenome]